MASPEYWLLTVPNRGDAVEVTLNKLSRATAALRAEAPGNPHRVDVPNLVVGTLDSLMALSDDLAKVDFQIESLVKRVERQYHVRFFGGVVGWVGGWVGLGWVRMWEGSFFFCCVCSVCSFLVCVFSCVSWSCRFSFVCACCASFSLLLSSPSQHKQEVENKKAADDLKVGGQPLDRYIANFNWEHAKYPQRRTLPELVALIQAGTGKIEEELKALSSAYGEKQQAVQALKRKKGGYVTLPTHPPTYVQTVFSFSIDSTDAPSHQTERQMNHPPTHPPT